MPKCTRDTLRRYISEFPKINEIKKEVTDIRCHAKIVRDSGDFWYDGEAQIKFDCEDRAYISIPEATYQMDKGAGSIGFTGHEEYEVIGENLGCEKGSISFSIKSAEGCSVKYKPFKYSWFGCKPPESFPKGTIFFVAFTNLELYSFSTPRFRLDNLYFKFKNSEDDDWKNAEESIRGKITNISKVTALSPITLAELDEALFSVIILFEIITTNRIRIPLIKFILPDGNSGYLLYHQSSSEPARTHFKMWYEHYAPWFCLPVFFSKSIKTVHEKRDEWNLTHFAEYLITSIDAHLERKLQNAILALETITSGYLLDKGICTLEELKNLNIEAKVRKINGILRSIDFSYFKIGLLKNYRNELFHLGKLPDVNKYDEAIDFYFLLLELSWFIFLSFCETKTVFNRPAHSSDLNYSLVDCVSCKFTRCTNRERVK